MNALTGQAMHTQCVLAGFYIIERAIDAGALVLEVQQHKSCVRYRLSLPGLPHAARVQHEPAGR